MRVSPVIEQKKLKTINSVLSNKYHKLRIKEAVLTLQSKEEETEFLLSLEVNQIKTSHRSYNLYPYEDLVEKLKNSLESALKKNIKVKLLIFLLEPGILILNCLFMNEKLILDKNQILLYPLFLAMSD